MLIYEKLIYSDVCDVIVTYIHKLFHVHVGAVRPQETRTNFLHISNFFIGLADEISV